MNLINKFLNTSYLVVTFLVLIIVLPSFFEKKDRAQIALLYPASHPSMHEIEQGVKETLAQNGTKEYRVDVYNANGSKTLLRAQAEEILHKNYLCIITIGAACSQTIHALEKKKHTTIPHVFCAIDDPIKLGLVDSSRSEETVITGCTVQQDFEKQIDALLSVKPSTKNLLFVYDPTHGSGLEPVRRDLESTLKKRNIACKAVQVYHSNEMQQKVMPMLNDSDVVFVYTDHTVLSGIESLITLCNRYGIPLYTSELNSTPKGAALSFGVEQYSHGKTAATIALQIVEQNKKPSMIPIEPVKDFIFKVNRKALEKQGLVLSQDDLNKVIAAGGEVL